MKFKNRYINICRKIKKNLSFSFRNKICISNSIEQNKKDWFENIVYFLKRKITLTRN